MTNKRQKFVCIVLCAMIVILGFATIMTLQKQETTVAAIQETPLKNSSNSTLWNLYSGSSAYLYCQVTANANSYGNCISNIFYYRTTDISFRFALSSDHSNVGADINGTMEFYLKNTNTGTIYQKKTFTNKLSNINNLSGNTTGSLNFTGLSNGTYSLCLDTNYKKMSWNPINNYVLTTIVIDTVSPTGTLSGINKTVDNKGYSNSSVKFTWTDTNASATLNGAQYTSGTSISTVGDYTIVLTDRAGNSSTYTFTIDKTAPTGTLSGVSNGGITKGNVTFSWTESSASATLNGAEYTSGTSISTEGTHTIILTDRAGNSSTYTFTIDKTAPTGTLSGVSNGGYTNSNVTFTWTDTTATAKLNGVNYTKGTSISAEGTHTIVLTDRAGNSSTYTFTIDKTAPVGVLYDSLNQSYSNNCIVNKTLNFTWTESNLTAKLNGVSYTSGTSITVEGTHTIVLTDRAGNSSTYTFTIDKTAPTGTLSGVSNGGYTNNNVTFTWTESNATATLNGAQYTSGASISTEGTHTIILKDSAGNSSTYTFTIDKTAPVGVLYDSSNKSYDNNCIVNKTLNFTWTESNLTATLNGVSYTSGTSIAAEGTHTIVLTDRAGNSSTYTFTIDKTAPVGEFANINNDDEVNHIVYFTWTEENCNIYVNDILYTPTYSDGKYNIIIDVENNTKADFTIKLFDIANNASTYTCTINKVLPKGELSTVDGIILENNAVTNKNIKFTFNSDITVTMNGVPYTSGKTISIETNNSLEVVFNLIDTLGNQNSYKVIINKILPITKFYNDNGQELYCDETNTIFYNGNVVIEIEEDCVFYINDNLSNNKLFTVGNNSSISYQLKVVNSIGNISTYTIDLSTIPYTSNYNYIFNNYKHHINRWYETYSYTYYNNSYIQSTSFAFSNYDDCYSYAYNRELEIAEYHESYLGGNIYCNYAQKYVDSIDISSIADYQGKPYYIYKDISNPTKIVAYFNYTNLNEALMKYADSSIKTKTIPSTPANAYPGDDFIAPQAIDTEYIYINNSSFSFPNQPDNNKLYINGSLADYSATLSAGINTVEEIDKYGNSTQYVLMLDVVAPQIIATDFANNYLEQLSIDFNERDLIYHNQPFRISIIDNLDNNAMLTISYNDIVTYIFGQDTNAYYDFNSSGEYYLEWRDIAGNKSSATVYLSLETPSINISENKDSVTEALLSFNIEILKNLSFNQILSIEISIYNEELSTYELLSQDSNGLLINNSNLNYYFLLNGTYKIIVLDRFGVEISTEYTFTKNAPTGTLLSVKDNSFIKNGAIVNYQVKFNWKDEAAIAYINGLEYVKNSAITAEGEYIIELRDSSGNITTYTFTIDKTAPKYNITGVKNGSSTNGVVQISWIEISSELGTTAQIKSSYDDNYNVYTSGTSISAEGSYTIILTDLAGNKTELSFTIDKTPPIVTVTTTSGKILENNSITNSNISFSWSGSATATLNGTSYTSGTIISAENIYNFSATDSVGNSTIIRIRIDKTLSEGTLNGVSNGGYTNSNVTFTWTEADAAARLNGAPYTSGTSIAEEGYHTIILYDKAGNNKTYSFTIDKTAPVGVLYDSSNKSYDNNCIINKTLNFTWTESSATATLNGVSYTSGTSISVEGTHTIVLTDRAGNSSTYTFTIDKTAPEGTLNGVENGGYTNSNVTFTWTENNLTATLNGAPYYLDAIISIANNLTSTFELILTDRAGNSSTYTFTIDKTAPVGVLYDSLNQSYDNNCIVNKTLYFKWTESSAGATLNGAPYTSGTSISAEGTHTIVLTDLAGNNTIYTFTIDKNLPFFTILFNGNVIENKLYHNYDITIEFSSQINAVATLNGEPYTSGTSITEEGEYIFVLTSVAGNSSTYTFTIDKTAPTGTLTYSLIYDLQNGGYANGNVIFKWTESSAGATLNGEPYASGTSITVEGTHTIVLTDRAGNNTIYTFTIDKTAPEGTLNGVENGRYTNSDVTFTWTDADAAATLNGEPYTSGTSISVEGTHTIVLTDRAGNSSTYTFTIDKTAPEGMLNGVENGGYTNSNVTFTWTESNLTATLNGVPYTSGTSIAAESEYIIILTDKANNSSIYTFTIYKKDVFYKIYGINKNYYSNDSFYLTFDENHTATLNGAEYTSGTSITEEGVYTIVIRNITGVSSEITVTIDKTAPSIKILDSVTNDEILDYNTNRSFIIQFDSISDVETIKVNNSIYNNNTVFSKNGSYYIEVKDYADNYYYYTITIKKDLPTATFNVEFINNETAEDVIIEFAYDLGITATLNGEPYASGTLISIEENTKASYELLLYDIANNVNIYNFSINKVLPSAILKDHEDNSLSFGITTNNEVCVVFDTNISATLNGAPYTSGTYIKIPSNTISVYSIIITNHLGVQNQYTFTYDSSIPTVLEDYNNDFIINQDVTFTWMESSATAMLNGAPYTSGTSITEEGEYIFVLTSLVGNINTYTFTIDKTAPNFEISHINEQNYAFDNVSITWTESSASATLNGAYYSSGNLITKEGDYTIVLTDRAGNSSTYTFMIDKTAPEIKITYKDEEVSLESGKSYYESLILNSNDTIYINGQKVDSGYVVEEPGEYTIEIVKDNGYSKVYTISIKAKQVEESVINTTIINSILIAISVIVLIVSIGAIINIIRKNKKSIL